jgi:hypothetical protein
MTEISTERRGRIEAHFWRGVRSVGDKQRVRVLPSLGADESYVWGKVENLHWDLAIPVMNEETAAIDAEVAGYNCASMAEWGSGVPGDGELFWQEREPLSVRWERMEFANGVFDVMTVVRRGNFGRKPAGYEWPVTP